MSLSLREALLEYDGKSTAVLSEIAHNYSSDPSYAADLFSLFNDQSKAIADCATWLLKYDLETGKKLNPDLAAELIKAVNALSSWAACLHICQSVRFLDLSKQQAMALATWSCTLLDHQRPFVRAWSLDVLVYLSLKHSVLVNEAKLALGHADEDDAASVRARARNLRKET